MNDGGPLTRIASLTFFMQSLDTTMLYLALPSMALSLNQSALNMELVIVLYMLTVIVVTPLSGWLTERWGARTIYLTAIGLFALGSLCCALSESLLILSLSRLIQGIGGALMLPVVRVVILKNSPQSKQLFRLNHIALLGLFGTLFGPALGGVIITYLSWQAIFIVNLPLCFICLILSVRYMPEQLSMPDDFDIRGFLLVTVALILIVIGLRGIGRQGLADSFIALSFVLAFILLHCYGQHQKKVANALFSFQLFRQRTFSIGILSNMAVRIFLSSVPLILSMMLQLELGYSAAKVSLLMLSMAVGSVFARFFQCQLLRLFGYKSLLIGITFLSALMIYPLSWLTQEVSVYFIILITFLLGTMTSSLYAAMNTLTFCDLTDKTYSAGNTILIITQLMSILVSVALSFTLLRLFSSINPLAGITTYHQAFLLISVGLVLCSLIFIRLDPDDGQQLLRESDS